jgi:hypothetical protein
MKKILELDGIVDGDTKRDLVDIFPELAECSFGQRKSYDEYYYRESIVELTMDKIERLSKDYVITIGFDSVRIK